MATIGLAVTIHDPEERHLPKLKPALEELQKHYAAKAATCTPETSRRTTDTLQELGFELTTSSSGNIGEARRRALDLVARDRSSEFFHYVDLDRLLHWHYFFADELREFLTIDPEADYVAIGRTERAFHTHPSVQIKAEILTNAAFAATTGLPIMDLVAGSCLISREAADVILRTSIEPSNATDLEWPAIVLTTLGRAPAYRVVDGLEFETCDYYEPEIAAAGSRDAWIQAVYDQPKVWTSRARLALDSIAGLQRVLESAGWVRT